MYEWATGKRLSNPEGSDNLSRDLMHLAQMTECTGQHHEEATLQRYCLRHVLQACYNVYALNLFLHKIFQNSWVEGLKPIATMLTEATVLSNSTEEEDAFINLMLGFLKLNQRQLKR